MPIIFELTLIITVATVLGLILRLLKQPLLVAYLAAGALLAYIGIFDSFDHETLKLFSDLGIMFLLFLVGMEINFKSLRLVGAASIFVGLGQIVFTSVIGFLIAIALGFGQIEAGYIAIALTFSSTIIIIKLLSDKKDTNSLYGKISIGMLLVQDMVAILLLVFLGSLAPGQTAFEPTQLLISIGKGLGLFVLVLILGYKLIPKIFDFFGSSQEMLFLASTAWVFIIVSVVARLGFSIEIAGFLAGLALANSSEHYQIASKVRPLRDFFILIFFILLGSSFTVSDTAGIGWPVVIFSLFVLIGNPFIVMIIMGIMGYRKRTGLLTGVTVAQISEFSLIVAAMGLALGHISNQAVGLITAVGIITITLSTYMIVYANSIYKFLEPVLGIFERKKTTEKQLPLESYGKPVVLIGYQRTGRSLAPSIGKNDLLIIDFDPDVAHDLAKTGYTYLFGDITDEEIFDKAVTPKTRVVVSTSPDLFDNLALIRMIKNSRRKPKIIVRAETERDIEILYQYGVDYAFLPNLTAGHHLGDALSNISKLNILKKLKTKDLSAIRQHKV